MNQPPLQSIPPASSVAVIGAGPIGLETAAWGISQGLDVAVFEKYAVGHHIRQWGHVRLFSPFGMNHSQWGVQSLGKAFPDLILPAESTYLTGFQYLTHYLEPLADVPKLSECLFLGVEVAQIGKDKLSKKDHIGHVRRAEHPFRLLLRSGDRELIHRSEAVIDASGVYSSPRFLGNGNIPAPGELPARKQASAHIHYGPPNLCGKNRDQFASRRTLLVGGGHSAATVLEHFYKLSINHLSKKVFWVNKSDQLEPYCVFADDLFPYRDALNKLANQLAASPPGWLDYLPGTSVEEIQRWPDGDRGNFGVLIQTKSSIKQLEVDEIIACVGFTPDNSLYRQLQVHECYASAGPIKLASSLLGESTDCLSQKSQGIETLKNPEPNFFILGNKSYGSNPTFLLRQGIEQVETVMNHLKTTLQVPSPTI